jgi:hypothetical protein
MLMNVVAAEVVGPHRVYLTLEDGMADEGEVVQLARFKAVFVTLADRDIPQPVRKEAA